MLAHSDQSTALRLANAVSRLGKVRAAPAFAERPIHLDAAIWKRVASWSLCLARRDSIKVRAMFLRE
jgi:hypothetical protein